MIHLKKRLFLFLGLLLCFAICSCDSPSGDTVSEAVSGGIESDIGASEESEAVESEAVESEAFEDIDEMAAVDVPVLSITCDGNINKYTYIDATVRITDPSGRFGEIFDVDATIKIRGNSTSNALKKPYNIKLSESENVLGLGESKKWYLLSNPYDKTLMRNHIAYDLAREFGLSNTSNCEYVDLYLNEKYRGCYLLCESIGIGKDRIDLNLDNNEFLFEVEPYVGYSNKTCFITPVFNFKLGYNDRDEPTASQQDFVFDFFKKAETAVKDGDWFNITRYFDIDSFVNYYIVVEYLKSVDTESSVRYYLKGGKLYAGPVWDIDLSMGNCDADYYKLYNNVGGSGDSTEGLYLTQVTSQWIRLFMEMDEFRELVRERMEEMQPVLENLFKKNELGESRIDVLLAQYGESFLRNYEEAGWEVDFKYSNLERDPDKTFEENVEYMRSWLQKRLEWMNDELGVTVE